MMEPTGSEDRVSRRNVFAYGILIGVVLLFAFVAGPIVASKFFPDDGTGSPGNPTRLDPAPKTPKDIERRNG